MTSTLRVSIAALALVAALVAAGCGSSDSKSTTTLSNDQAQVIKDSAAKLQTQVSSFGTATQKCISSGSPSAIKTCVKAEIDKTVTGVESVSTTLLDQAKNVSGACKAKLQAFAASVKSVGTAIRAAGTALVSGDAAGAQAALAKVDTAALSQASTATDAACHS